MAGRRRISRSFAVLRMTKRLLLRGACPELAEVLRMTLLKHQELKESQWLQQNLFSSI